MDQEDRQGNDAHLSEGDENLSREVNGVALDATLVGASIGETVLNGQSKFLVEEDNEMLSEVNGVAVDAAFVNGLVQKASASGASKKSVADDNVMDSKGSPKDVHTKIAVPGVNDQQGTSEASDEVNHETSYSATNAVNSERDTGPVIVLALAQGERVCLNERSKKPDFKDGKLALNKVLPQESKKRVSEIQKDSCVIDIQCGSGRSNGEDGENVCRICHLGFGQSPGRVAGSDTTTVTITASGDLIHLGCACKDELGIAHSQCAEAWFKLKGNRLCEICSETAKNVAGVGDERFMEEWNDRRFINTARNPTGRGDQWWRRQPFCNFLMACLVIAFVLPWFFRVNIF